MKRKMIIVITVIAAYLLFLWDFEGSYTNYKKEYKFKYNGLLWVALDYWTIKKYQSDDKPMEWVKIQKINWTGQ